MLSKSNLNVGEGDCTTEACEASYLVVSVRQTEYAKVQRKVPAVLRFGLFILMIIDKVTCQDNTRITTRWQPLHKKNLDRHIYDKYCSVIVMMKVTNIRHNYLLNSIYTLKDSQYLTCNHLFVYVKRVLINLLKLIKLYQYNLTSYLNILKNISFKSLQSVRISCKAIFQLLYITEKDQSYNQIHG